MPDTLWAASSLGIKESVTLCQEWKEWRNVWFNDLMEQKPSCSTPSFGFQSLSSEVAFVSTSLSFQSSFSKTSRCRLSLRRSITNQPRRHAKAVLDKRAYPDVPPSRESHINGGNESPSPAQHEKEALADSPSQSVPNLDNDWYSVVERIGCDDKSGDVTEEQSSTNHAAEEVVDLMKLDGAGRHVLTNSSYDTVVDVDIEEGGVLDDDEDNNDIHCGVELDALVESPLLVENLRNDFQIETATHVQLAAIPRVLDGRDLVIQSHTGTGKTLAFLLPILDELNAAEFTTQAIIMAPTRELAMQISRECDRLVAGTEIRSLALIGGANPARQVEKLKKRQPHVVIGTPGRLAELHEQRELRTHCMRWFVVDEVDQCLGEAFVDHVVKLLKAVPQKQTILVSATGDVDGVRQFAGTHLHRPVLLRVGGSQRIPKRIQHYCCIVPARMKIELVKKLVSTSPVPKRAIAFVDDPRRVDVVVEKLYRMGVVAGGLKGSAHKLERADVLAAIKKGRINLLVTTEVAARGLDVREITHVINLDLPTDGDHYLHRAGRCGRAGEEGFVVSIASPDKAFVINRLASEIGVEIPRMEPRFGRYSEPVMRTRKMGDTAARARTRFARAGRETNENESSRILQDVGGKDTESNEVILAKQAEIDGDSGSYDFTKTRSEPKKKKEKKEKRKGQLKAEAKAKAKEKLRAKAKSAARKQRGKTAKIDGQESGDNQDALSGNGRRKHHKRKADISYRAVSEGWVGNRAAIKEEE